MSTVKWVCDSKYIVLPVSHQAVDKCLKFTHNGKLVYDLAIGLDNYHPDFYAYVNMERFRGLELEASCVPDIRFEIRKADTCGDSSIYTEKYRPGFHFSSKRGWLNDPNGLVYYKGIYHMFYQHNPVGCKWGNMHWGHAQSRDLVHWKELDIKLYPDALGTMFSGSAIMDFQNITGFKKGEEDPILLYYTSAGDSSETSKGKPYTQCLAYSCDGGKTFAKYAKNPIIPELAKGNRDPKVIRHESGRYIMALYLDKNRFALLSSDNLLDFRVIQEIDIENESECPDFFPLPLDGDPEKTKWVLIGASEKYLVGSFDGQVFTKETGVQSLHYGKNSYAGQSWSDTDPRDGRRLRITWNNGSIPSMPFNMAMTFPTELKLKTTPYGMRLFCWPVREIEKLYEGTQSYTGSPINPAHKASFPLEGRAYDIKAQLHHEEDGVLTLSLLGLTLSLDSGANRLRCLDSDAPLMSENGHINLRLLVDSTSVEIYVNEGQVFLSNGFVADYNINRLEVEALSGSAVLESLVITRLKNIWTEEKKA